MIQVGAHDVFEYDYRNKLRAILSPFGLLIDYSEDRATLDLGLHLYQRPVADDPAMSQVRVWFQAKGIRATTLPAATFEVSSTVAVKGLPVEHVRFWYGAPMPVYLVVYVEAQDVYLADDVRELVDRAGGHAMLSDLASKGQESMTLHLPVDATLDDAIEGLPMHRSMRVDGPAFRGRPLGHRYDPLRSELKPLLATDFEALVQALLAAHEFQRTDRVSLQEVLDDGVGTVTAMTGVLRLTYEWISPLFTEFGTSPASTFRIEGEPERVQGEVLVVVHSAPTAAPKPTTESNRLVSEILASGTKRALVFFNASELKDSEFVGGWSATLAPLAGVPQGLGSLAFNVLTASLVYLDFADRLRWRYVNFL